MKKKNINVIEVVKSFWGVILVSRNPHLMSFVMNNWLKII